MELKEKLLEYIEAQGIASLPEAAKALGRTLDDLELNLAVTELLAENAILKNKKKKLCSLASRGLIRGILEVKRGGFAFVRHPDGDVFIPAKNFGGAFNREEVLVELRPGEKGGRSREGAVRAVLSPPGYTLTGTFRTLHGHAFVECDDRTIEDIRIPSADTLGAYSGQKVLCSVTRRQTGGKPPAGRILEILGFSGAPGVDILCVAKTFGLVGEFPDGVRQQLSTMDLGIPDEELAQRETLFGKLIFTIDGADSKDLDDAISLESLKNGNWLLGVHIADVTHYVREGTPLDREAIHRGTSVYLIDRVIPMLPRELSNGICSLNPREARLTLSCFMEVNRLGRVVSHRIAKTAIISRHKMTYGDVNAMLEGEDAALIQKYGDIYPTLRDMASLAAVLRKNRFADGSIDFDIGEAKILLDKKGRPTEVGVRERGTGEKLIEEFMLLCNNTVAEEYFYAELPFLYRIHETPDTDKMRELAVFLSNFGYQLKGLSHLHSKALQDILNRCAGQECENIINRVILRSLKKAKYSTENAGHFGLASRAYTHFTSPIRRYPDLQIHRIIKENIDGRLSHPRIAALEKFLPEIAAKSSERERNAIEAERQVDGMKKAEYMSAHIGETFSGVISGVSSSALFVELPNTIEGVVPLASMKDDFYIYNREMYCVIGERTRKRYNLGDKVTVDVLDANASESRIEFRIHPRKKSVLRTGPVCYNKKREGKPAGGGKARRRKGHAHRSKDSRHK